MEKDDIYRKIQEAISSLPDNFSILEEQVDIEVQMEYFNYRRDLKSGAMSEPTVQLDSGLFDSSVAIDDKKKILALLASREEVESYRIIEKYAGNPDPELQEWSILALQESRMVMQSSLLDEQQVYISTGLGGKGQNLRYFVVFIANRPEEIFTATQTKLIENELSYALANCGGTLEEINFEGNLAMAMLLLPVKFNIQHLFTEVLDECNQYGDFISPSMIITNVKRLSALEIRSIIENETNMPNE